MTTYCVLGAGHGGLALAGHLGLMGFNARLWSRSPASTVGVAAVGGVLLEGVVAGFGPVRAVSNLQEALDGADVVLVAVPASAHAELAELCAPYLSDGQKVLLLPGRTAGAIEFSHGLRRAGCTADLVVGEAQSFPYASRRTGPHTAHIHGFKRQVLAAALPAHRTEELLDVVRLAFPQFRSAPWVWKTSLDNIGAIFHPAVALLNAARIETTGGAFRHYVDGISRSVAGLLEQLDGERVAIARALGVGVVTAREWVAEAYGVERSSLYDAIQEVPAYATVGAPLSLDHRYIWEDVPTGLVPIAELGKACGMLAPVTEAIINLADTMCQHDFRRVGRTLERLGMTGWSPEQIARYALEGDVVSV